MRAWQRPGFVSSRAGSSRPGCRPTGGCRCSRASTGSWRSARPWRSRPRSGSGWHARWMSTTRPGMSATTLRPRPHPRGTARYSPATDPQRVLAALRGDLRALWRRGVPDGQHPRYLAQRAVYRRMRPDECGKPPAGRHSPDRHQLADLTVRVTDLGYPEVHIGREPPVQLGLGAAGRSARLRGREIKKAKVDRFFSFTLSPKHHPFSSPVVMRPPRRSRPGAAARPGRYRPSAVRHAHALLRQPSLASSRHLQATGRGARPVGSQFPCRVAQEPARKTLSTTAVLLRSLDAGRLLPDSRPIPDVFA